MKSSENKPIKKEVNKDVEKENNTSVGNSIKKPIEKIIKKAIKKEVEKPIEFKKPKKIKDLTLEEHRVICSKQSECIHCDLLYIGISCVLKKLENAKNDIDIHLNKIVETAV